MTDESGRTVVTMTIEITMEEAQDIAEAIATGVQDITHDEAGAAKRARWFELLKNLTRIIHLAKGLET